MTNTQPNHHTLLADIQTKLTDAKDHQDRQFVTALGRGLLIMAAFEQSDPQNTLSHQQLCQMSGLPKATVTRLIYTLIELGFVRQTPNGEYALGRSAVRLSAAAWRAHDLITTAQPLLRQFAIDNEVSVNIASEIDGDMRYLACHRSPARLSVNLQVGSSVPVADTAIGRAFYAISDHPRRQLIEAHLQRQMTADAYLRAIDTLTHATDHYERLGYTISDGQFSTDILAVAVGIFDRAVGEYAYSINASVPRAKWDAGAYAAFITPKLKALAADIGTA